MSSIAFSLAIAAAVGGVAAMVIWLLSFLESQWVQARRASAQAESLAEISTKLSQLQEIGGHLGSMSGWPPRTGTVTDADGRPVPASLGVVDLGARLDAIIERYADLDARLDAIIERQRGWGYADLDVRLTDLSEKLTHHMSYGSGQHHA